MSLYLSMMPPEERFSYVPVPLMLSRVGLWGHDARDARLAAGFSSRVTRSVR